MPRRVLKLAIRLVGPALLVVVLYRLHGAGVVLDQLDRHDILPLTGAMLLGALNYYFKVLRWDVLLAARGHRYSRLRAWTSFLSSGYVGLLTPGRVGDLLRVQYLRHDLGIPYADGLALLTIDRLCDLYVLLAFAGLGVALLGAALTGELALVLWLGVAVTALGPLLLLLPGLLRRVAAVMYRWLPGQPELAGFDRFLAGLKQQRPADIARAVVWTILAFVINYLQGYLLAVALNLDLGVLSVVGLLAVSSLLGLLPISISGLGVRELFFALAFPLLGHSSEAGVIYGLGVFLVIYVAAVIMGFISWQVAPPPVGEPAK
ncbi:lysylphosphatidylglycerol synthase transmembrane domain-containing protein [Nannocystis sp.]|uniref:lysylphosphatidylglycerol synthase transmembrane domain-containing protein n=1 Tax=Nannocystis sp. TaxID=1962667 RepID=UPI002422A7C8|nr:lysylphosphatidylglycerol synthase transmembrane domain-containing protein [Nannocystis sp.]MBK7827944.1 flippase-like domain-containing protein [Nannocystis sp.]MBK9752528.1 flippase-like domain-containing protein [Nannocystis sp.]